MSRTPSIEMRRLESVDHPGNASVVAKAIEFCSRRGISTPQFADMVGVGGSTMIIYLSGRYAKGTGARSSTEYMDAKVWSYVNKNWPVEAPPPDGELLDTKGFRQIRECVQEAIEMGANSLIYGPPSTGKSYVAKHIAAQYRAAGRRDLLHVYCSVNYRPLRILRDIARKAEVWVRANQCYQLMDALVHDFNSRELPPAIILDEAQHMHVDCFEALRELREKTERRGHMGSGMVVMGSHELYSWLNDPIRKYRLEQWLSRNSYRVQLEGMKEAEVLSIAAVALGQNGKRAKLTDAMKKILLDDCRVPDVYATDENGKPLRDEKNRPIQRNYYSPRRLLEVIRQRKRKNVSLIVAEEVV